MLSLSTASTAPNDKSNELHRCTFTGCCENNRINYCNAATYEELCSPSVPDQNTSEAPKSIPENDKIIIPKESKQYLIKQSGAETTPSSSKRATTKAKQSKESFKQFLAKSKNQRPEMERVNPFQEYLKDDYETAASCQHLIRSKTGIIYDDKMALHECPWDKNYPENPNRYNTVMERCRKLGLIERCFELPAIDAHKDQIIKMHTEQIYKKLQDITAAKSVEEQEKCAAEYDAIYFNDETFNAALLSAGCAINLVQAVCGGVIQNGMAIIRPPGHHAMNDEYCGYCYFNNVAVAAQHALDNNFANKILIVDFDVHHGQGTQRLFYNDNRVLYFSIHRYQHGSFWPNLRESNFDYIGEGNGKGYNINFPLNVTGLHDRDYLAIATQILLPVAYEYQPDLIILSAGYDACIGCPEGEMEITPGFYGHLITLLSGLAQGKLAVCLEGGYFLPSLAEGAAMTLKALLGDPPATMSPLKPIAATVIDTINNLRVVLHDHWDCFRVFPISAPAPGLHIAKVYYKGKPEKAPFLTRDCYPPQSKEHIAKYSKIISNLQNEYQKLGTNQLVSCCYDEDMLLHRSATHVETPTRLFDTYSLYKEWGLDARCVNLLPKIIDSAIIKQVHQEAYVDQIMQEKFEKIIEKHRSDMYFNENTLTAIMKAAGCLLAVVDSVMRKRTNCGVALIRPPGHHADTEHTSGFCYLNNVAVAARYMMDTYRVKKILIIDFDIHHGNGTQNIFYRSRNVLYLSIHRYEDGKYFPYSTTGNFDYCGAQHGEGYNVNIPMNKDKLSNIDYITIFHRIVLPIAYSYAPEVILVSAGFDAGIHDSLGNYLVTPECFGHFIQMLKPLANGNIILALEGGYNPTTVKYSMNICIKTLLGDPLPILDLSPSKISDNCFNILSSVIKTQRQYWPIFNINNCELAKGCTECEEDEEVMHQIQKLVAS